jgi:hypothetical protein
MSGNRQSKQEIRRHEYHFPWKQRVQQQVPLEELPNSSALTATVFEEYWCAPPITFIMSGKHLENSIFQTVSLASKEAACSFSTALATLASCSFNCDIKLFNKQISISFEFVRNFTSSPAHPKPEF